MMQTERDYALSQKTWLDRQRFRPQQWSYREKWKVYNPDTGEGWYGFNSVRDLDGLPPEILFVPLQVIHMVMPALPFRLEINGCLMLLMPILS